MNIDSLKTAWHASVDQVTVPADIELLAQAARARAQRYQRAACLRVVYGTAAFVLALAMLAALMLVPQVWLGMRVAMAVWSAGMLACVIGLWRIRGRRSKDADVRLDACLRASLRHIQREIAYQRALRWLWWLPFGVGLLAAGAGRISDTPDLSWLVTFVVGAFWTWGFIQGPRHWPQRLQPEAVALQTLVDELNIDTNATAMPGAAA